MCKTTFCLLFSEDVLVNSLLWCSSRISRTTHRNEYIWHSLLILLPRLAVSRSTPFNVPKRSVNDHAGEEHWVKPRERALKAGDKAPCQSKIELLEWSADCMDSAN